MQTVVLWTYSQDHTALIEKLAPAIEARGARPIRFDTDRFPTELRASIYDGDKPRILISDGKETRALGADDAIWYRRVRYADALPAAMDGQLRAASAQESRAALEGLLAIAPCFVMDPLERVRQNKHKSHQFRIAREVGLKAPRSLTTNDPDEARAFLRTCEGGAVAKMLSSFAIYEERDGRQSENVVFTTLIDDTHIEKLSGLRYCPMVFQERIQKAVELRITAVGARLFAAAVDSMATPGADVDWRERGAELISRWRPYELPLDVESALHRYLSRAGMQYSAIDMIVEPSGRHVFLEANVCGEFFWLEKHPPHFPLADAIADVLTGQPGARRTFEAS